MARHKPALPFVEFVALLALMTSIVAMSIDAMLPALDAIGADLALEDPNDAQLVVSALFFGFAAGQLIVGPLSDSVGRRPVICGGYALFIAGCVLSAFAETLTVMILGRVLQGLGAAGPRIVSISLVRDCVEGPAMARIQSIVMSVFILAPAIAPSIGQAVSALAGWRAIFGVLLALGAIALLWFTARQRETLNPADRRPFTLAAIRDGARSALSMRVVAGYTLTAGLIMGAFIGYLSSAQQIFQVTYRSGGLFPLYFGLAALSIGAATVLNAVMVLRFGMRRLSLLSAAGVMVVSILFLAATLAADGRPDFLTFMVWLLVNFFCIGFLFGNLNALAMEPLGDMAGLGASVIGAVSTFVALPLGWFIGDQFDGGVTALAAGFAVLSALALAAMLWTERRFPFQPARA